MQIAMEFFFCRSFLIFAVKNSGKKFYATGPRSIEPHNAVRMGPHAPHVAPIMCALQIPCGAYRSFAIRGQIIVDTRTEPIESPQAPEKANFFTDFPRATDPYGRYGPQSSTGP